MTNKFYSPCKLELIVNDSVEKGFWGIFAKLGTTDWLAMSVTASERMVVLFCFV